MDLLATPELWVLYETPRMPVRMNLTGIRWLLVNPKSGTLLGGAIALLLMTTQLQAKIYPDQGTAYVATPPGYNLNIRSGPGTRYPAVNTLARGTPITITGFYEHGWAQLTDRSWVAGNLIDSAPVTVGGSVGQAYNAYIATPVGYNLNVRSGPGTQYPAINTLARGTPITITGYFINGWAQLTNGGWVAGNWIQVTQPVNPPPTGPRPVDPNLYLQLGSRGPEVLRLERRLQTLGYLGPTFNPDTYFDSDTQQAVRDFQWRNGLPVDGIVGPQTRNVLYSSALPDNGGVPQPQPPEPIDPVDPLDPIDPGPAPSSELRVSTDDGQAALVFSGPGTQYDLLGFIDNGTLVTVTDRTEGNWTELSNGQGWIYTDWLEAP
jgi:uncharacterized protein YraI